MTYANRVLGSIPYGTLIGAPLTAAVEAQALAAQSSVDFIRSIGFVTDGETEDFADVRSITFTYQLTDTDTGDVRSATLTVPLLTIVNIPFLRIDDMTIDFTSKITEEMIRNTTRTGEVETDSALNVNYGKFLSPVKVGFKASVSTKHSSTAATSNRYKTEHTININVRAIQDDIPAGMSRVLDILESGIGETSPS
jgi:hypothetical protein